MSWKAIVMFFGLILRLTNFSAPVDVDDLVQIPARDMYIARIEIDAIINDWDENGDLESIAVWHIIGDDHIRTMDGQDFEVGDRPYVWLSENGTYAPDERGDDLFLGVAYWTVPED